MNKNEALKQALDLLVEISVVNRSHTIAINKTLLAISEALSKEDFISLTSDDVDGLKSTWLRRPGAVGLILQVDAFLKAKNTI